MTMLSTTPGDAAAAILQSISGASAVTLEGGYAVFAGPGTLQRQGQRVLFEPARMTDVRRDQSGRCTHAVAKYRDGSSLTFTWNASRGHRYVRKAA